MWAAAVGAADDRYWAGALGEVMRWKAVEVGGGCGWKVGCESHECGERSGVEGWIVVVSDMGAGGREGCIYYREVRPCLCL